MSQFDNLEKLMEEYHELKKAYDLLAELNTHIDPYSDSISNCDDLPYRIAEYFGLDDSD